MPKMTFSGTDALNEMLTKVSEGALPALKHGLFDGAGLMASSVKDAAGTLPYKDSTVQQIQQAVGIAKFDVGHDGTITTAISFEGYFEESGFPIPFFVRMVEKGTSRIRKHPIVRQATNKASKAVEAQMAKTITEDIEQLMK